MSVISDFLSKVQSIHATGNATEHSYQPAQKWLKDRKGRVLTFDDAKHYQRILKILAETDRIMGTITMTLGVPA